MLIEEVESKTDGETPLLHQLATIA